MPPKIQDFREGRTVSCSTCGHCWWSKARVPSCSKCAKHKRNPYNVLEGKQAHLSGWWNT